METNVNPDDDWNDAQWIEDEIDAEDAEYTREHMHGYDIHREKAGRDFVALLNQLITYR